MPSVAITPRSAFLIHLLDCFLLSCRGEDRAELAVGIDLHRNATGTGHAFAVDAGDIGGSLCAVFANADLVGIARCADHARADHDVVTAGWANQRVLSLL